MKKTVIPTLKQIVLSVIMIIVTAVVKILKILVVTMLTIVRIIKMTIKILTARIGDIVLALTLHT